MVSGNMTLWPATTVETASEELVSCWENLLHKMLLYVCDSNVCFPFRNNPKEGNKNKWYKTESIVTSDDDHHESPNITCCASNSLGKECTQLHHFGV